MLVPFIRKIFQGRKVLLEEKKEGKEHAHHGPGPRDGSPHEEAHDHFDELLFLARNANDELAKKQKPFRFEVIRDGDSLYIYVIKTAPSDASVRIARTNITHSEFHDLVKNLENLEGMIVDIEI